MLGPQVLIVSELMIDSHCHLADPRIFPLASEILSSAAQAGIHHLVQAGVDPEDWARQRELRRGLGSAVVMVAGLHPYRCALQTQEWIKSSLLLLEDFVQREPVAAIGEIGLDFREDYSKNSEMRHRQAGAFVVQLQYANRIGKPVVLHVVRAHDEALRLLKLSTPKSSGMVHSFNSNWSVAKRYLDLGLMISIGTSVLQSSASLAEVLQKIPSDRLLVETDSPDQKPRGQDGPFNSPIQLIRVVEAIASLRAETPARIATWTSENALRLFGIEEPPNTVA